MLVLVLLALLSLFLWSPISLDKSGFSLWYLLVLFLACGGGNVGGVGGRLGVVGAPDEGLPVVNHSHVKCSAAHILRATMWPRLVAHDGWHLGSVHAALQR